MVNISRKGMDQYMFLISIIFAIMGIGAITVIMISLFQGGSVAAVDQTCRNSVIVKDKARLEVGPIKLLEAPIVCPSDDPILISGNREQIKGKIANLMAKCWFRYVEGNINNIFDAGVDTRTCRVCTPFEVIPFKEGKIEGTTIISENTNSRPENKITIKEMYNFILVKQYNAPLLYGGGTKETIGDSFGDGIGEDFYFDSSIDNPREIDIDDIKSVVIGSFVKDYSTRLDFETIKELDKIGTELLENKAGNLYIIVVDEFDDLDRSDARNLIEELNLNSADDVFDAILILVDLENQVVRVQMGVNLELFIREHELFQIMKDSFAAEEPENIDKALLSLVKELKRKILDDRGKQYLANLGLDTGSYYAYMANGLNYPMIIDDIEPGYTYTINYGSTIPALNFMDTFATRALAFWDTMGIMSLNPVVYSTAYPTIFMSSVLKKGAAKGANHILVMRINQGQSVCTTED